MVLQLDDTLSSSGEYYVCKNSVESTGVEFHISAISLFLTGYFKPPFICSICSRFSVFWQWKPSEAIESEFLMLTPNTLLRPDFLLKIYAEL